MKIQEKEKVMTKALKLWSGSPITPETIPLLDCVTHAMVHRAQKRHYQFLLGADIIKHKDVLFCGWGNSKAKENDSRSIMAGRRSHDNGLSCEEFEIIAPESKGKDTWAEGGLIINGSEIQYIFRNGWAHSKRAQLALSRDYGENWSISTNTNIPMSTSKPCCGMLSTGQRYLIFNPADNNRNSLAVAVSNPGEQQFGKIWHIQHGSTPQSCFQSQWAYPLAHEYDNKLYVVYTASKEDCVLSIIPLAALN